jgi:hypothetical protein
VPVGVQPELDRAPVRSENDGAATALHASTHGSATLLGPDRRRSDCHTAQRHEARPYAKRTASRLERALWPDGPIGR